MSSILLDLNVRDPFVSASTDMMLEDTKVVIQSLWRLLTTEEGEVPYFREYGLDIKQFSQYPLSKNTASMIYNYVKDKVTRFEQRATIVQDTVSADFDQGTISMKFLIQVLATGESVYLPTWTVKLNAMTI